MESYNTSFIIERLPINTTEEDIKNFLKESKVI